MKTIIHDVCDVVARRLSDNKIVFWGEAQTNDISVKVQEDKIYGGIGSMLLASLQSQREIDFKVSNAFFDSSYLEMVLGSDFANVTSNTVWAKENNLTMTSGKITIVGTPITNSIITVIDPNGNTYSGTFSASQVSVTGATDGPGYTVLYQTSVNTGNVLSIDCTKFSQAWALEAHTIEYQPNTQKIIADIYFQFDSVIPAGNFDISLQNGKTAKAPEITLSVLRPIGSNVYGRVIQVPRAS